MTAVAAVRNELTSAAIARVWRQRMASELEAAERFRLLGSKLDALGASTSVLALAREAARDELRHADLCRDLAIHFAGTIAQAPRIQPREIAPAGLGQRERVLYEVVALCCVTETLSTALLGALVEAATDSFAKQTMHAILRDEVKHSRLGWAYLAEAHARGADDCIGIHLADMLRSTTSEELFEEPSDDAVVGELTGLGALERIRARQITRDALDLVIFPGLERFGIQTEGGRQWLRTRVSLVAV